MREKQNRKNKNIHLSAKYRKILEGLFREHLLGVEVWAYGSRVNGKSHPGSDLDLVLRAPGLKEIDSLKLYNLKEALEESNIPFLVEARDWVELPKSFHQEIERNYIILIENNLKTKTSNKPVIPALSGSPEPNREGKPLSSRPSQAEIQRGSGSAQERSSNVNNKRVDSSSVVIPANAVIQKKITFEIIYNHFWPMVELGDVCVFEYGKPLKKEDRKNGKYPVFGSNGVVGYHNKYLIRGPCIIVGRKGTAGEITYSENDCFPIDTTFFVRLKNKNQYDLKCLYFIMRMSGLKNLKTQSNVPGLNRNEAYKLPIPLPPLEEQKRIAGVLSQIQKAITAQDKLIKVTRELKQATMKHLFTYGTRETSVANPSGPVNPSKPVDPTGPVTSSEVGIHPGSKFGQERSSTVNNKRVNSSGPVAPTGLVTSTEGIQQSLLVDSSSGKHQSQVVGFSVPRLSSNPESNQEDNSSSRPLPPGRHQSPLVDHSLENSKAKLLALQSLAGGNPESKREDNLSSRPLQARLQKIPAHWDIFFISDIGKIITGTTPKTANKTYYGNEYKLISPTDLDSGKYITTAHRMLSKKGLNQCRVLPKYTVLIGCIGNVGKIGMTIDEESATNQQINAIICNKTANPHFIFYLLDYSRERLKSASAQTTVPILNKTNFEKFKIPLPPLGEQKEIADILQKIDEKISVHEKKKLTLEELLKTMLNQLMTGTIRVQNLNINNKLMEQ